MLSEGSGGQVNATPSRPNVAPGSATRGSPAESLGLTYSEFESPSPVASEHSEQEVADLSFSSAFNGQESPQAPAQASSASAGGGYLPSTRNAIEHSNLAQSIASSKASGGGVGSFGGSSGGRSIGGLSSSGAMRAVWDPPPEPEEDGAFNFEIQGVEPDPVAEIHATLREEMPSPLELAVLAKLEAWNTSGNAYTVQDIMNVVRWLEPKVVLKPRPPLWQRILTSASPKRKFGIAVLAMLCLLLAFSLLAVMTGVMLQHFKDYGVETSGLLTLPQGEPAGVGEAVDFHGLLEFPQLPAEELRRARDVVFTHEGVFHFYRISSLQQTKGGGVKIAAQDGTRLLVEDGIVSFERPWASKEILTKNAAGAQGSTLEDAAAFKSILAK